MLNELQEFLDYTGKMEYSSTGKYDFSYLGRFTFDLLKEFEGLTRVLTIIARHYMRESENTPDFEKAKAALCAWCSIPDEENATPKENWQFITDYRYLQEQFPELVDKNGCGWFCNHVHNIIDFANNNPEKLLSAHLKSCKTLEMEFDSKWRKKVVQLQIPLFCSTTKGAWVRRFDDIIADALELGALKNKEIIFTPQELRRFKDIKPEKVDESVVALVVAYYRANKADDSDWVVLPVSNFDCYYGNTNFSKQWLKPLAEGVIERQNFGSDICRFRVRIDK